MFEVDADLVGASGVKGALDEAGSVTVLGDDFVVGDGCFACAGVKDGHLLAVDGVSSDVGEDGVFGFSRGTSCDGVVNLGGGLALGELGKE